MEPPHSPTENLMASCSRRSTRLVFSGAAAQPKRSAPPIAFCITQPLLRASRLRTGDSQKTRREYPKDLARKRPISPWPCRRSRPWPGAPSGVRRWRLLCDCPSVFGSPLLDGNHELPPRRRGHGYRTRARGVDNRSRPGRIPKTTTPRPSTWGSRPRPTQRS
jgi:hypothetical protein